MTSMHCYFCDQTSPEGSLFCKPCGSPFHLAPCPRCAAVNDLKVVSCYKCKAILPIRRAETKAVASNDVETDKKNIASVAKRSINEAASGSVLDTPVPELAAAPHLVQPAMSEEARLANMPIVTTAEIAGASSDSHAPIANVKDDVAKDGYQKTIPVRRRLEKVHDEDYQKTIALQRVAVEGPQLPPTDLYDANYQKTIALQRRPVDIHDDAYIKTISLRHPPASLAGGTERDVALNEANSLGSAISINLRAEERARLPTDLVQKVKWGQRALLASFALLLIVTAAYFFLRAQQTAVSASSADTAPVQLQTEALARIPLAPVSKTIDPSPLKLSVDAAKQADKKVGVQSAPAIRPPLAKPAAAIAVTPAPVNRQTKAAPPGEVLYLPPGATAASAAATAAAIAEAIGKKSPAPPASAPAPGAVVKGTSNSGAASSPPAPCTEALAALGLCVVQPAPPKP